MTQWDLDGAFSLEEGGSRHHFISKIGEKEREKERHHCFFRFLCVLLQHYTRQSYGLSNILEPDSSATLTVFSCHVGQEELGPPFTRQAIFFQESTEAEGRWGKKRVTEPIVGGGMSPGRRSGRTNAWRALLIKEQHPERITWAQRAECCHGNVSNVWMEGREGREVPLLPTLMSEVLEMGKRHSRQRKGLEWWGWETRFGGRCLFELKVV